MSPAAALAGAIGFLQRGEPALAARECRAIIAKAPDGHEPYHVLAISLTQLGQLGEAEQMFRAALARVPDDPGLNHDLASLMLRTERPGDAIQLFDRAISLRSGYASAYSGLAAALAAEGRVGEAVTAIGRSLELNPDDWAGWNSLGGWLSRLDRFPEAEQAYLNAVRLAPASAFPRNNLGNLYRRQRRHVDARAEFEAALRLDPGNPTIRQGLALALVDLRDYPAALSCVLDTDPWHPAVSWSLSRMLYSETSADRIAHWHREFGRRIADLRRTGTPRMKRQRIRLGYLSADLHHHPVGWFLRPLLRNHDRSRFEIIVYDAQDPRLADDLTMELKGFADAWRLLGPMPPDAAADMIRRDELDMLVETGGHTDGNRLDIVARCPAPLQASYLGYPGSTGLAAVDYLITDANVAPPGTVEDQYSETLVRLDRPFFIFEPPAAARPEVAPLPARSAGYVTFGAFHGANKLVPEITARWAQVLARVPGARLLINAPGLNEDAIADPLRRQFEAHGIASDRLQLIGFLPMAEHFALYEQVDIILDSFPWNGHTSSINALWHGVPLVVQTGRHHAARMGAAILKPLAMDDWIADSADEYVEIAVRKAGELSRLEALRESLRNRLAASVFFDHRGFVAEFESRIQRLVGGHR